MKKKILVPFFVIFLLAVQNISAKVRTWEFDKVHSNFYFSVDHILSKVHGHFSDFSGTIKFDPKDLDASSFVFEIEVDSINTDNGKRDKHLLSADFFDESKYPTIRFTSKKITATGDNAYGVTGIFNVKGQDYELTLPLTLAGIQDHPMEKNKMVAGFNGKFTLDRLAFKVGTGKFKDYGVVGQDVEILISLEVLSDK